jgi:hypothetical protein
MNNAHRLLSPSLGLAVLVLAGCGRDVTPSDVKLLNVGNDPEQIGPAPTPYGGIVEYNHVDIAGGALPLGVMGLRGYTQIGPDLLSMAPPYEAVFALSYLFDVKLRGASNLALVLPPPPAAAGSCYTQIEPQGPFDSGFNTVDVGDWLDFRRADDDTRIVRMERIPRDYPPESARLSVYYQQLEGFSPSARTRLVPAEGSDDPADMVEVPYRFANFPFGEEVTLQFPGGFTTFDRPVASIPHPSASVDPTVLTLPQPVGGVQLDWNGPKWAYQLGSGGFSWGLAEGTTHSTCLEFTDRTQYGDPAAPPESPDECGLITPYPGRYYKTFKGQMYTGPWSTDDKQVMFSWVDDGSDDEMVVAVKFLAGVDPTDDNFVYGAVATGDPDTPYRSAQVCEVPEYIFDSGRFSNEDGSTILSLQGNPSDVLAQVVCKVDKSAGSFALTQEILQDGLDYARERGGGGAIFLVGRVRDVEAQIPGVKDPYDQLHDVNPIKIATRAVKVGRFFWDFEADSPAGGEQ